MKGTNVHVVGLLLAGLWNGRGQFTYLCLFTVTCNSSRFYSLSYIFDSIVQLIWLPYVESITHILQFVFSSQIIMLLKIRKKLFS